MTDTALISKLWRSGFVNRWHSHPDPRLRNSGDTTAAHSQRVAILLMFLFPASDSRPRGQALLHDAPEMDLGDTPAGAKRADLDLCEAIHVAEASWWGAFAGMVDLDPRVHLCDLLDAILLVKHVAPDLLARDDWRADIAKARHRADDLGVLPEVEDLLK
jgi:5'-deoxynucleotidase YfbR-like HD superfamily hydrolase